MIEVVIMISTLLTAEIFLIWLFSDEHCDKAEERMIEKEVERRNKR